MGLKGLKFSWFDGSQPGVVIKMVCSITVPKQLGLRGSNSHGLIVVTLGW